MLKSREGRYGLQPVPKSSRIIRPLGPEVCSSHLLPAKNRTSGPKGHKDDIVYAGDKSPAYPEDGFSASCLALLFLAVRPTGASSSFEGTSPATLWTTVKPLVLRFAVSF
jgi:hypothetical protein